MTNTFRSTAVFLLPFLACTAGSAAQAAGSSQSPVAQPAQSSTAPNPASPAAPFADDRGARDTRDRLSKVLEQYPPSVRQVLRIDTSLLSRPDYLATYPTLAAFLEQHPEVAHNPAYFIGTAAGFAPNGDQPPDARIEAIRGWRSFMELLPVALIVFIITSALAGLVRSLLDQRKWQRAARMQVDMHSKLIDRFTVSDELLAYVRSPSGQAMTSLLAPGPSALPRQIDAPIGRILWSLQGGIVLVAAGIGLVFVGHRITLDELSQPLSGLGILGIAVGTGFAASAAASFLISRRLGLVTIPATPDFERQPPPA